LYAIPSGTSKDRLSGSIAKITPSRYTARNPNIGRIVTPGQFASSSASNTLKRFIASDGGGNFGRLPLLDMVP